MSEDRNSFGRPRDVPARWTWFWRAWFALRSRWRHVRIRRGMTRLLGPQYRRSRDRIEIDITYACNLHCLNCNRSVRQAPQALHLPLERVREFVDASIARGKVWRRIRVLGGEPTLHPQFDAIVRELGRYRGWSPRTVVEVVTNGHGPEVEERLRGLPKWVWIENSRKEDVVQPTFGPFNLAPADDPQYAHADYRNGCAIVRDCGMGLTPQGYYPCAIAGGIDRITKDGLGRRDLPDDADDMEEALARLCRLCGRFRDGHFIPLNLRPPLLEERMSPAWTELYARWRRERPSSPADGNAP